ncbi:DoxX family membrane protein [Actinomadura sp. LD22]|uniref:DoxX family membrane protein n=1 Tax=Actinomadura physcomitrii TaxID=2650748 RepID=A0A6I4M834_9ACTN|nr:DoxX family protein [Actinomadura physcomitrii]MVZ99910.1 DoxX family membrane protein [Actinomadura physcomitrii]
MLDIDIAAAALRLTVGGIMIAHGRNHLFGPGGVEGTARWFGGVGLRPPRAHAWASGLLEMGAGAGLLLGLVTPLWSAAIIGVCAVAGIAVHRANGFFVFKDGYEYVLALGVMAVAIAALGPGTWSLDHLLHIDPSGGWAALGSLVAGLGGAAGMLAVCWRPSTAAKAPETV